MRTPREDAGGRAPDLDPPGRVRRDGVLLRERREGMTTARAAYLGEIEALATASRYPSRRLPRTWASVPRPSGSYELTSLRCVWPSSR